MPPSNKNSRNIPKSASSNTGKVLPKQRISDTDKKIIWDFSKLAVSGRFGFHCNAFKENIECLDSLFLFLQGYSSKSWGEVRNELRPAKGDKRESMHHEIPFEDIDKRNHSFFLDIQRHLGDIVDEYTGMYSFHLSSRIRVYGLKNADRFFVVFFDRDHSAYPIQKSHT